MIQYLAQLRAKYMKLMEGKYGIDSLSRDMLVLWIILGFINGFIGSRVVMLCGLLLPLFAGLRMFSTAVYKRSSENRKYLKIRSSAAEGIKLRVRMIKERKTHRYYKCKNCSVYIRVKRKKGEHTIDCPKCGKEIRVKIR